MGLTPPIPLSISALRPFAQVSSNDTFTLPGCAAAIKALAATYPGKVKVSFELTWANGRKAEIDSGIGGVRPTPEFLAELEKIQKGDDYRLTTVKDIFLQPPEPKRWERRQ